MLQLHFHLSDAVLAYASANADADDVFSDAFKLLLDAFDAAAYADANDANADAKMPNVARHLAGAYVVLLLPPLLSMLILLRQLMRADACNYVMLKCVCICSRLCLSCACASVCDVCVCALVSACIFSAGAPAL